MKRVRTAALRSAGSDAFVPSGRELFQCVESIRAFGTTLEAGTVDAVLTAVDCDERGRVDYLEVAHAMKEGDIRKIRQLKDQAAARSAMTAVRKRYRMLADALYAADTTKEGAMAPDDIRMVLDVLASTQYNDVAPPPN